MADRQKEARIILSDLIADGEFPRTATKEEKATYLKKIEKWLEDRDDAPKREFDSRRHE